MSVAKTQCKFLDTKTQGKLSLVLLLTGIAVVTELFVNFDRKNGEKLHAKLGQPDKAVEFQRGFDRLRIEWYGEKEYAFRNGVLQKKRWHLEKKEHQRVKKTTISTLVFQERITIAQTKIFTTVGQSQNSRQKCFQRQDER